MRYLYLIFFLLVLGYLILFFNLNSSFVDLDFYFYKLNGTTLGFIIIVAFFLGNGSSCHVGYRSCFYRSIPLGKIENARQIKMNFEEKEKKFDPKKVYKDQPNPTKI